MSGDLNTNFNEESSELLINFLKTNFNLKMSTNKNIFTTKYQTTIDAVFQRNIKKKSENYVSYFSDDKPIITCINFIITLNVILGK